MAEEQPIIYFDNNATTFMTPKVVQSMTTWINRGNPSSSYAGADQCKQLIVAFRKYIATLCKFTQPSSGLDAKITPSQYRIIFTSGASESNNTIIRTTAAAYKLASGTVPHIITSAIEHKSILMCCEDLAAQGLIEYTLVQPDKMGFILVENVKDAIKSNTTLICIMAANNETGVINDYKGIGALSHKNGIPFYTDSVQLFGKYPICPTRDNVDAFSVSFHKLYGPAGMGLLVVKEEFLRGYNIKPLICGTQNDSFRGGTENISLYAGAYFGMKENFAQRMAKNKKLLDMKRLIMTSISKYIPCKTYKEYLETQTQRTKNSAEIVFMSMGTRQYLPNTLMLTIIKRTKPFICNVSFKNDLEKQGIIISIGSACNTASEKASHVIYAMNVDSLLRKGMLRISLGDHNTLDEVKRFINVFMKTVKAHVEK